MSSLLQIECTWMIIRDHFYFLFGNQCLVFNCGFILFCLFCYFFILFYFSETLYAKVLINDNMQLLDFLHEHALGVFDVIVLGISVIVIFY